MYYIYEQGLTKNEIKVLTEIRENNYTDIINNFGDFSLSVYPYCDFDEKTYVDTLESLVSKGLIEIDSEYPFLETYICLTEPGIVCYSDHDELRKINDAKI